MTNSINEQLQGLTIQAEELVKVLAKIEAEGIPMPKNYSEEFNTVCDICLGKLNIESTVKLLKKQLGENE